MFMKQSIVTRMPFIAALATIILTLAVFAHADDSVQRSHKQKKGTLSTTVATEVGPVTLQPGDYEVKEVDSQSGPFLRFTKVTENYQAQEGLPVYDWEVVAEVKCTVEPLASKPTHTGFLLASDTGKATGLEIRGSSAKYLFDATDTSASNGQ
jgi:hypothetical protein